MRWNLISSFAQIHLSSGWRVNWVAFVWIDNDAEEARIGVDQFALVSNLEVMEDRCIIKICKISHVLTFLKLRRVYLADFFGFKNLFLQHRNGNLQLVDSVL